MDKEVPSHLLIKVRDTLENIEINSTIRRKIDQPINTEIILIKNSYN